MKKLFTLLLCLPLMLSSQTLPDSLISKIDRIFSNYKANTPGCAVAIIQKGQVVFSKGYGLANLEYGIPITPNSIFHIASESKQYVAFCILLLEQQGKLSLEDDIRKHLDFVPDFGKKISIRNLIYHTSGLRDQWQLLAIAGWQLDDVITQEHVIKMVAAQKTLNFSPGDEHMYCNTGYTLLAEIIKKTSGLTLRQYCDKYIFQPLGMKDTHFHDNYLEIVKNRTYSYDSKLSGGFQHSVLSYSTVGATSLFTSVEDEAKWLLNYEQAKVGDKALIEKMYTTGSLNSGKKLKYAFALSLDTYKGFKRIGHGGSDAGYRTYTCRFPEIETGIIIFSNLATVSPYDLSNRIADLLLPAKEIPAVPIVNRPDSIFLKRLVGSYYTLRGNQLVFIYENGKLLSRFPGQKFGGNEWILSKLDENRYQVGETMIIFNKMKGVDSIKEFTVENGNGAMKYFRQPNPAPAVNTAEYIGRYYNDETESFYTVVQKNEKLLLQHHKYSNAAMQQIAPDQFSCTNWWMSHLHFLRNKKGEVDGFEVNSGRVQHLLFIKLK